MGANMEASCQFSHRRLASAARQSPPQKAPAMGHHSDSKPSQLLALNDARLQARAPHVEDVHNSEYSHVAAIP
jgi:hypothetical protein